MFCYRSTHPEAKDALVLYDDNHSHGSLWSRNSSADPLQPCSASWTQKCIVCLQDDQDVYAMCKNLTDKPKMVMEAIAKSISISESDCPALPEDAHQAGIIVAAILLILLFIIIIIGVVLYRKCKSGQNVKEQARNGIQDPQAVELRATAAAEEESHTP